MNRFSRLCAHAWIVTLLAALAVLWRVAALNLAQMERISALGGGEAIASEAASPTGYAGGLRRAVLPELQHETLAVVVQTQHLLATGEWRLRQTDADNAPEGRPVFAPSGFRWWVAAVAWVDSRVTGRPLGQSVERAAVLAGPALLGLVLAGATVFAVRFLGAFTAGVLPVVLVTLFPFASNLLSPLAGARDLTQVFLVAAALPLAAAVAGGPRRWVFAVAGVAAGAALWLDVGMTVPLLLGIAAGALVVAWRQRGTARAFAVAELPWRLWAGVGAATSLLAYVLEYAPGHLLGWRLDWNHPSHAVAWLALGELVARGTTWLADGRRPAGGRGWTVFGLAVAVVTAWLVAPVIARGGALFGVSSATDRMTLWPGTGGASESLAWLLQAPALLGVAVLVPLLLLVPAGWMLWRGRTDGSGDAAGFGAAVLLVVLGFAGWHPALWAVVDVAAVALLAVLTAPALLTTRLKALAWAGALAAVLVPGPLKLWSEAGGEGGDAVSDPEFEALLYRDLAQWLAGRVAEGGPIVLAPPVMTSALHFYGGVRGFGTPDPESTEGFAAAVRICATTSSDEGEALSRKRGITHVILPSWDPLLEEYARIGSGGADKTLVSQLKAWLPPRWLRPVPYIVPQTDAASPRSVVVFEVTEVQDQAGALARMAEYFAEMGRADEASMVAYSLGQAFAEDLNSLVARGVVAAVRRDGEQVKRLVGELRPMLERGDDVDLPWDRRVALAVFLAQVRQPELAKPRIEECLGALDEPRLRHLSTMTLFRLLMIAKAYGVALEDETLRGLAFKLLPAELRARVQ